MATKIMLPVLGESISEAVLLRWLKQSGEPVHTGEEIAELETSKATLSLESPGSGVLLKIYVEAGARVEIGQLLALVGRAGELVEEAAPSEAEKAVSQSESPQSIVITARGALGVSGAKDPIVNQQDRSFVSKSAPQDDITNKGAAQPIIPGRERRVSPLARRLAKELGVDIRLVQPEKPGARVTSEAVQQFALTSVAAQAPLTHAPVTARAPFHRLALGEVRRVLAARMLESAQTIPQFSVSMDFEMDAFLQALVEQRRLGEGFAIRPSLTALLATRLVPALRQYPWLNARYEQGSVLIYETVNLAVATSTPHGLMAPVLYHLESLTLDAIARQLTEKAERARQNCLALDEVTDSTFTLSNLGMYGVTQFVPLINPPQAAILGVGAVRPAVVPLDSGGTRHIKVMTVTLSADHRLLDGEMAALFLTALKTEIETIRI